MEWWLLTFFLGAILSLFIAIVPEFSLLFLILVFSTLLLWLKPIRPIVVMFFGACWLLIAAGQYQETLAQNNIAAETIHKKTLIIRGSVANIVQKKSKTNRFNFTISHWQGRELSIPFMVRLSWKLPKKPLLQGQQWQLAVRLKPAHGFANIGGFNYQAWLTHQQIVATGYVKPDVLKNKNVTANTNVKAKAQTKINNILITEDVTWRQQLYQKLAALLTDKPLGALLLALGFGERGELTDEQWRVLLATATIHLIAISGLHIGIVAFVSFIIARSILKFLPLAYFLPFQQSIKLMRFNIKYLPIYFSCAMAWYYAYLAGFSIPTLRALVMLFIFWLLKLSAMHVSLIRWLLLTILAILLSWPLSLLSASFWLSISALAIIFATSSRFLSKANTSNKHSKEKQQGIDNTTEENVILLYWLNFKPKFYYWFKALIVIQLSLTVCMLPIAASLSYQLPLLAFFANIIAVPLMSMTIIPLTLFAVITVPLSETLSQFFLDLAHFILALIWRWLVYITNINWAQISISNAQLSLLFIVVLTVFIVLFFRFSRIKIVFSAVFVIAIAGINTLFNSERNTWQLSVLEVGHGLAVVIEKNGHVFIYDTGASYPSGFNMAEAAILPYLKYQGYQLVDTVIISHNDNDHAGGLKHLREHIAINNVMANDIVLKPDQQCLAGQTFTWQGLFFEVLSPTKVMGDKNDDSCVVIVSDGAHRILLSGDISSKQEKRLINNAEINKKLASDVLVAPHHGSKSSSSVSFLKTVAPDYAIFSTGYLNRWRMPSKKILSRYQALNIVTFNTAEVGMVTFKFTPTSIEPFTYRAYYKPYWFVN